MEEIMTYNPQLDRRWDGEIVSVEELKKYYRENDSTLYLVTCDFIKDIVINVSRYDLKSFDFNEDEIISVTGYKWFNTTKKNIYSICPDATEWTISGTQWVWNRIFKNLEDASNYAMFLRLIINVNKINFNVPEKSNFTPVHIDPFKNRKKIIGIVGFKNSGKDTIGKILGREYGYVKDSFAGPLKDLVSVIFGWDRSKLEGTTPEDRIWREQKDEWWSERLGFNITPRYALQYIGTDILRKHFNDDIWLLSLQKRFDSNNNNIVITDCRFYNELIMIKKLGGVIIRVKRGDEPEWFEDAIIYNTGIDLNGQARFKDEAEKRLKEKNVHSSEYSWAGFEWDAEVENNGHISDLENNLSYLVENLKLK